MSESLIGDVRKFISRAQVCCLQVYKSKSSLKVEVNKLLSMSQAPPFEMPSPPVPVESRRNFKNDKNSCYLASSLHLLALLPVSAYAPLIRGGSLKSLLAILRAGGGRTILQKALKSFRGELLRLWEADFESIQTYIRHHPSTENDAAEFLNWALKELGAVSAVQREVEVCLLCRKHRCRAEHNVRSLTVEGRLEDRVWPRYSGSMTACAQCAMTQPPEMRVSSLIEVKTELQDWVVVQTAEKISTAVRHAMEEAGFELEGAVYRPSPRHYAAFVRASDSGWLVFDDLQAPKPAPCPLAPAFTVGLFHRKLAAAPGASDLLRRSKYLNRLCAILAARVSPCRDSPVPQALLEYFEAAPTEQQMKDIWQAYLRGEVMLGEHPYLVSTMLPRSSFYAEDAYGAALEMRRWLDYSNLGHMLRSRRLTAVLFADEDCTSDEEEEASPEQQLNISEIASSPTHVPSSVSDLDPDASFPKEDRPLTMDDFEIDDAEDVTMDAGQGKEVTQDGAGEDESQAEDKSDPMAEDSAIDVEESADRVADLNKKSSSESAGKKTCQADEESTESAWTTDSADAAESGDEFPEHAPEYDFLADLSPARRRYLIDTINAAIMRSDSYRKAKQARKEAGTLRLKRFDLVGALPSRRLSPCDSGGMILNLEGIPECIEVQHQIRGPVLHAHLARFALARDPPFTITRTRVSGDSVNTGCNSCVVKADGSRCTIKIASSATLFRMTGSHLDRIYEKELVTVEDAENAERDPADEQIKKKQHYFSPPVKAVLNHFYPPYLEDIAKFPEPREVERQMPRLLPPGVAPIMRKQIANYKKKLIKELEDEMNEAVTPEALAQWARQEFTSLKKASHRIGRVFEKNEKTNKHKHDLIVCGNGVDEKGGVSLHFTTEEMLRRLARYLKSEKPKSLKLAMDARYKNMKDNIGILSVGFEEVV